MDQFSLYRRARTKRSRLYLTAKRRHPMKAYSPRPTVPFDVNNSENFMLSAEGWLMRWEKRSQPQTIDHDETLLSLPFSQYENDRTNPTGSTGLRARST